MDTLKAIQFFLDKMFTEVSGMKVLLLDPHTVSSAFQPQVARLFGARGDDELVLTRALPPLPPLAGQTPIVSLATTQSSLLTHEVYLTDRIEK